MASSDPTFRSYKPAQAQQYANLRPAYPSVLYEHIVREHASSGGGFGFVVDVGCGPGSATRDLARSFEHAVGVDPGQEMVNTARERGGETKTKSGEQVRFEVGEAERLADDQELLGLPVGRVDMITAATAAHWFDMKKFYAQAAQLLRPGGTIAIWCRGRSYAHPKMPHHAEISTIQSSFEQTLQPYLQPGNKLAHEMYDHLPLPWTCGDPTLQTAFPQNQFRRFDWDRDGVLSDGEDFFGGSREMPVGYYEKAVGTASQVTRWREAHPELVGTERDVVKEMIGKLKAVLGEEEGKKLRGGSPIVLLMFKKAGGKREDGQV